MTGDNRRGRRRRKRRSVEKKTSGATRGGDASLLLPSAAGFSVYQVGVHPPASEISCSHFGLHGLDVCFLFTSKSCYRWECCERISKDSTQSQMVMHELNHSIYKPDQVCDKKEGLNVGTSRCVIF